MMTMQAREAGVRGADPVSYEAFVEARSAALYRKAYLLTGNRSDAEDLVQVALVKLYVAWRRASRASTSIGCGSSSARTKTPASTSDRW